MDLKNLLGKLDLLEGSMNKAEKNPTGPKFTGQWKGTDKGLPGKKLVGDSIEPQENILKDLAKGPTPKTKEQDLAEQFEEFLQALEEENLGVETKRPARKGSRPGREYTSNEKPSKRYKTIKEDAVGDSEEANAVVAEIINLISDGHTEVSPDVIIAKVSAQLGRPFMLKDLVATNNNSPELQHYISSINPTKIKFSTDILTVKNEDPMKEKQAAQNGVANMAARAASRPRLGESDQGISKSAETKFHKKLDTLVHDTFGKRKDEVEESAEELNVGDDVVITGPVEHQGETGVIDSFGQDKRFVVVNLYNHGKKSFHSSDVSYNDYADSDAEEAEMYDRDPDFRDWAARQDVDESRGDPHKILINKLRDIERKPSVPSAEDEARRAEQAKADYAKYVAKMRKKDPNFVPLYKIDEYGADAPAGTAAGQPVSVQQQQQAKNVDQATQTLKAATGSTAPTTNLAKAIDAASKGTAVDAQNMKTLEPIMKDVAAVASDPKLANQFKSLASQINQVQAKQAQQKT